MKQVQELLLQMNQKLECLNSNRDLKAIYQEGLNTISVGDVTHGRVLRIPIESGYYFSFPMILESEINQLTSLFSEEDQKRIDHAIKFQKTSFLLS